jgi:CDP-diglyceride synthetase
MRQRLSLFFAALWWGSAVAVGAWVVPMLFAYLGNPSLAGMMASKLFSAQTWVALLCGLWLLLSWRRDQDASYRQGLAHTGWVLAGMLAALLLEAAVSPRIIAREQLALWHAVGTGLYALQTVSAGMVLWRFSRGSVS